MKLTALKSVKYAKQTYAKGETFEVPDKWGRVLVLIGRAKRSDGGDEFGIEKPKKARPAFKEYAAPAVAAKPAEPVASKSMPRRAGIATSRKEIEKAAKPTAAQLTEFARTYKTRDMGVQPPTAPAAEPLKVEDVDSQEIVKPHEKPAE